MDASWLDFRSTPHVWTKVHGGESQEPQWEVVLIFLNHVMCLPNCLYHSFVYIHKIWLSASIIKEKDLAKNSGHSTVTVKLLGAGGWAVTAIRRSGVLCAIATKFIHSFLEEENPWAVNSWERRPVWMELLQTGQGAPRMQFSWPVIRVTVGFAVTQGPTILHALISNSNKATCSSSHN